MKSSTLTTSSIQVNSNPNNGVEPFLQVANRIAKPLLDTLNNIGTAIALGEKGDLEAAYAFRRKNAGQ